MNKIEIYKTSVFTVTSDDKGLTFSFTEPGYDLGFARWLPILLDKGLAEQQSDQVFHIQNESIYELIALEEAGDIIGFVELLPPQSPYSLELKNTAFLASQNLSFEYSFFYGVREEHPIRIGCFLKTGSQIFFLSQEIYQLLDAVDTFNGLSSEQKGKGENLRHFARIKLFCDPERVGLTDTLANETAIIPEQFHIGFDLDEFGRVNLVPKVNGIEPQLLKQAYYRSAEGQAFYDLQTATGERIRVVVPEQIQEAFTHMRKNLTGLSGEARDKAILNPLSVFEGVCSSDLIDMDDYASEMEDLNKQTDILASTALDGYGKRVIDIGPYIFQPIPRLRASNRPDFLESKDDAPSFKLDITASDGSRALTISSQKEAEEMLQKIQECLSNGETVIRVYEDGATQLLPVTQGLCEQLQQTIEDWKKVESPLPIENTSTASVTNEKTSSGEYFLHIAEDYSESSGSKLDLSYERPKALIETYKDEPFELKSFQQTGVAWLQASFKANRSGVLLADDMGLGKTLQVLTFLAWLIESGWPEAFPNELPFDKQKPILIVAPVILLENWKNEIEKFFAHNGNCFCPVAVLNSRTIKQYIKDPENRGREYVIGTETLDRAALQNHRIIITNYDTIKNYQHSLGKMQWSVLVADEAQKIKNEKTAITFAMKALASNAKFKIAMSGTPIENGLMDLWCIIDFVCPGQLLGTAKEFSQQFESKIIANEPGSVEALKARLKMPAHDQTFILNRYKEDYLGHELPEKIEQRIPYPVSEQQWQLQQELIKTAAKSKSVGAQLKAVQRLKLLYEHPALLTGEDLHLSSDALLAQSPKLQVVCSQLDNIRQKREKALVFTRSLRMQDMLKRVFALRYHLNVAIINGSSKSTSANGESERYRSIREFEEKEGFNLLILSPDVAGVGLTIVGANHVIHYGRWWNPAMEDQATCRAYRIGQTKPVSVYYPIATGLGDVMTFEQKLDDLLVQKSELRRDILTPLSQMNVEDQDIWTHLTESAAIPV